MLNTFRKSAKSNFAKVLYVLIAISFVAWGVDITAFNLGGTNHPAEVDDRPVTVAEVDRTFQGQVSQLRQTLGGAFTAEQAIQFGMLDSTVQQLISQVLLENEAVSLGVGVDDETVRQAIFSDPSFQTPAGGFDRQQFSQLLSMNRYTEAAYIEELRNTLIRRQLVDAVASGISVPPQMSAPIASHRAENRSGRYFVISTENVPDITDPTDADLASYHSENPVAFTAPEYRETSVVLLTAAQLAETLEVTQEEILTAYDENIDRYRNPESRKLRQVLFTPDREEDAKAAAERLAAGEDFDTIAQEAGMLPAMTDLGTLTRDQTLPDLQEAAFTTPEGSVSAPVQTPFGWHVIKVDVINAENTQPLTAVGDELAEELKLARAAEELFDMVGRFEDQLGGGASLEQAASEFGFDFQRVTLDAQGNDTTGAPVTGLPSEAMAQTFELEDGEEGQMTEFGAGDYFIQKVERVIPSALRPLSEVRGDVEAAWRADARAEKAKGIADGFAAGTDDFARLADAAGYSVMETGTTTRDGAGAQDTLPSAVLASLFDLAPNGRAAVGVDGGHAVLVLDAITGATATTEQTDAVAAEFRRDIANDLLASFGSALAADADVRINRDIINQMYGAGSHP